MEEEEALGRWKSLASARKAATLGAFAIGTFSIGFTLGGLASLLAQGLARQETRTAR